MKSLYELTILIFTDDDGVSEIKIKSIKDMVIKSKDDEEQEIEENEEN